MEVRCAAMKKSAGVFSMAVGLLFSGGLDSTILLRQLLCDGQQVQPFYICAGLDWESVEIAAAKQIIQALRSPRLNSLVMLQMPVRDLYADHWSTTGNNVPGYGTTDEAVFLPGRNGLLVHKAALWCQLHGIERLALAVLSANPFRDARVEFFQSLQQMFNAGMAPSIEIVCPFAHLTKRQVIQQAFDCPLHLTFSCLAPSGSLHCGHCNKCAERRGALREAGRTDHTTYAIDGKVCTK